MNYQELVNLVGGANPQGATYRDIVSGIQSQYTPQTQFAPTMSLLDMIGEQLPEQRGMAYGSLLQAQPRKLPPSIDLSKSIKNTDAIVSVDSGDIKTSNVDTGKITGNTAIDNALVYALAGNSDLVKTAIALNLIGSAADIRTEEDVLNLGTKIAMLAAGPAGNVLAAGLGLASDNTPMTVNALLGLTNPTLSLLNSISGNLTGFTLGDIVNGLLNAPEGAVSEYGLLGAANLANTADASRKRAGAAYDSMDANTLRVLAELGDQEAIETIRSMSSGSTSTYNPIADLGTARGNSYFNLFSPIGGGGGGKPNVDYFTTRAILAE